MARAFLSLGSNIGDRHENLLEAIQLLEETKGILSVLSSPIYETAPVGFLDQANFLNLVLKLETNLQAESLLEVCQSIEQQLGRKRTIKNGPRTIDLDILLYDQDVVELAHLQIPHPRMHERAFVLIPFAAIEGEVIFPTTGETIQDLIQKLSPADITDVKEWDSRVQYDTIADRRMNVEG